MAKIETPPVLGCEASAKQSGLEYWINPDTGTWWNSLGDTNYPASGPPGLSAHIGDNGNWWMGDQDLGVPASGTVIESGPQSASELF